MSDQSKSVGGYWFTARAAPIALSVASSPVLAQKGTGSKKFFDSKSTGIGLNQICRAL